ncbi:MAG: hypothetical protein HYU64_12840 [Armatimonadetes bacterium]|nr:hypothetical protein [Armatimonadota bacterium]
MRPLTLPIFLLFCSLSAPMFGAQTGSQILPQEIRAKLDWLSEASIAVSKPVLIMLRHCQTPGMADARDFSLLSQLLDTFVVEEVIPQYERELLKPERRADIAKKLALFSLGIVQQGKSEKIQPLAVPRKSAAPPDPFQGSLVPFQDRKLGIAFQYRPSGWILYQEGAAFALFPK